MASTALDIDPSILSIGSFHPPEFLGRSTAEAFAELVWQDPERVGGAPCFRGTRLPIYLLFENLREGTTLEAFCENHGLDALVAKRLLDVAAWLVLEHPFSK